MKIMSRDFTTREKVLLVVLFLILLGLVYYYFVDIPVRDAITSAEADEKMFQDELDQVQVRLQHLRRVQQQLDELQSDEDIAWMGSYNNSKREVAFLNDILADTQKYSIAFADVTRNGDQIRRNFTLQYQTQDYTEAQEIMTRLCASEDRCLVSDVKCRIDQDGVVTINATATFYETMVGGVPDAGLPSDGATTNQ